MSPVLFADVIGHFKQAMKRNSGFDEHSILRRLPVRVRDRLMLYHYHDLLEAIPFFRYISNPSVKMYLLKQMKQLSADAGRYLVREDDMATEMVFMFKGTAELKRCVYSEKDRRVRERAKYGHLGAALLWCLRAHRAYEVEEQQEREEQLVRQNSFIRNQLHATVLEHLNVDAVS